MIPLDEIVGWCKAEDGRYKRLAETLYRIRTDFPLTEPDEDCVRYAHALVDRPKDVLALQAALRGN